MELSDQLHCSKGGVNGHASEIHIPVLKCMGKSHGKLWCFNALRHLALAFLLP
jgi:hypothetical protein